MRFVFGAWNASAHHVHRLLEHRALKAERSARCGFRGIAIR